MINEAASACRLQIYTGQSDSVTSDIAWVYCLFDNRSGILLQYAGIIPTSPPVLVRLEPVMEPATRHMPTAGYNTHHWRSKKTTCRPEVPDHGGGNSVQAAAAIHKLYTGVSIYIKSLKQNGKTSIVMTRSHNQRNGVIFSYKKRSTAYRADFHMVALCTPCSQTNIANIHFVVNYSYFQCRADCVFPDGAALSLGSRTQLGLPAIRSPQAIE